jgi:hypothetical protein
VALGLSLGSRSTPLACGLGAPQGASQGDEGSAPLLHTARPGGRTNAARAEERAVYRSVPALSICSIEIEDRRHNG